MKQNEMTNILFNKATEFIIKRYPKGWGGAAVLRTDQNNYIISVAPETCNAGASLCIETGAICEAHKIDEAVTHSICIVRENEESPFKVLTPCGICQERLMYWDNVLVGVTTQDFSLKLVPLTELQPFHWTNAYDKKEMEFYANN